MRLLDLFSGGGGAAMGYHQAGFTVVGVDISPQPDYPFEFIQADALDVLADRDFLAGFDLIHVSPPCQIDTQMRAAHRSRGFDNRADLLTPTRALVRQSGLPYVIENVPGAKKRMQATLKLHGGMFGLGVDRPRLFECSELILAPRAPITSEPVGVYGSRPMAGKQWTRLNGNMKGKRSPMRVARSLAEAQAAMGIDWMTTWEAIREAVPPDYTYFIALQLIDILEAAA